VLSLRHRFHGRHSLRGVYEQGRSLRGPLLSLRFKHRDARRPYRVAVVVSRKVSKSAVTRNRIRRRIYEQVRLHSDLIQPGSDLVFTAYNEQLANIESAQLADNIKELLGKAGRSAGV